MAEPAAGTVLARVELPLDPVKVAELARAVRGEPGTVPPTVTVLAAHHTGPGESPNELVLAAAELDRRRVLLGELSWTWHRLAVPGSTLVGAVRYQGRTTRPGRRGGTLQFACGSTSWQDPAGAPVAESAVTLIEPASSASSTSTASAANPTASAANPTRPEPPSLPYGSERLRLSRTDIVRYAGASGDFNPVHHDEPYARRLGHPGVFAMGLLPGGILAARAARLLAAPRLARLYLRFSGPVWPDTDYQVHPDPLPPEPGTGPGLALRLVDPSGTTAVRLRAYAPGGGPGRTGPGPYQVAGGRG